MTAKTSYPFILPRLWGRRSTDIRQRFLRPLPLGLQKFADHRERAFTEYFKRRKENADALADLAIGNFIEMRDKTASKTFRAKKKLDHLLEAALPGVYLPLYTMVTFTRVPYAEAARRARLQDRILYAALVLIGILALAVLLARSQRQ